MPLRPIRGTRWEYKGRNGGECGGRGASRGDKRWWCVTLALVVTFSYRVDPLSDLVDALSDLVDSLPDLVGSLLVPCRSKSV